MIPTEDPYTTGLMNKKILITGGPVHGKLDAVKIITNKFKGGLMASLADDLSVDANVVYLCSKGSLLPDPDEMEIVFHDGIDDYMAKVLEIAPSCDGVVLGAAVANLVPANPLTGKFPSHNYKPGDIIPIDFKIAPRIIDAVKKVAPNTKLFGFKLLAGVTDDELVSAAYGVLLESKSVMVFANRDGDLNQIKVITKERGVIDIPRDELSEFIVGGVDDEYYRTVANEIEPGLGWFGTTRAHARFETLAAVYRDKFSQTPEGYMFGTIAVRDQRGFLTTGRGKNELADKAFVESVDHERRVVTTSTARKATLNAPLLSTLFNLWPMADAIVHWHRQEPNVSTLPYAPSGTVRDSLRDPILPSFNIAGHGHYRMIFP